MDGNGCASLQVLVGNGGANGGRKMVVCETAVVVAPAFSGVKVVT